MSRNELSERSGVSISFISDLTAGNANPSLRVMEAIATALETPLPHLLESTDLDKATLDALAGKCVATAVPQGYQRVSAILPDYRAFQVKQWAADAHKKLKK